MLCRRPAVSLASLAFLLLAAGCSSSSSNTPSNDQSDDDSGNTTSDDAGGSSSGGGDATVNHGDSGSHGSPSDGGDASSSNDEDSATVNATTSGDAGVAAVCAGLCGSLEQCSATLDAGAAQPCHCGVTGTQLLRTDYVDALTTCVSTTISAHCTVILGDGGPDAVVESCEAMVASNIQPTQTAATFCKNLGLGVCANAINPCESQIFTYSDPTLMAASNCLSQVPATDPDGGGCNAFAQCLQTAFTP
jgi:hypothetical protein